MPKTISLYANIECEFMRSFRFLQLPVGARFLYLSLWCYALEQRRERIRRPSDHYISALSGLRYHSIKTYLLLLKNAELIDFDECEMVIIGLRQKHKKLQDWKDEIRDQSGTEQVPNGSLLSGITSKIISNSNESNHEQEKFEEFWKSYPKSIPGRNVKTKSLTKWKKLIKDGVNPDDLIKAAKNYAITFQGRDNSYVKGCQSFLSDIWTEFLADIDYTPKPAFDNRAKKDENELPMRFVGDSQ